MAELRVRVAVKDSDVSGFRPAAPPVEVGIATVNDEPSKLTSAPLSTQLAIRRSSAGPGVANAMDC